MGHLTTRHYVAMFDDSIHHLFAELGANLDQMQKRGEGFAAVKSTLEYKQELRSGDLIVIEGTMLKLGDKSFVHRYEMSNRTTGELAATMENITIAFDLQARKAVPLFESFRKSAQRYLDKERETPLLS